MDGQGQRGKWVMNQRLRDHFFVIRNDWWKIAGFSMALGIVTFLLLLMTEDVYQASASIAPSVDEKTQNPVLGSLVSFGVNVGGKSKIEDLEALFRSKDLTVRVFRKYDVWPYLLPDEYDQQTKTIKPVWWRFLFGEKREPRKPSDWDAIRIVKKRLKVMVNRKLGTLTLTFECPSPTGAAAIVGYYLEEAKSRLQEEAFDRASTNKRFIGDQISKTVDALTRERLYSLYGQEIEKEMLARNRQQFAFTLVDSPMIPDKKIWPHRVRIAFQVTIVSLLVVCLIFIYRESPGSSAFSGE
jgi:uncharacterized protein involved in exopolysaccharide biosynthesis